MPHFSHAPALLISHVHNAVAPGVQLAVTLHLPDLHEDLYVPDLWMDL